MSTNADLDRFAIVMNLDGRPATELIEFARVVTSARGCMMGDVCFQERRPYEPHALYLKGGLFVGCREDLIQIAKWDGATEVILVPTKDLWPRLEQAAKAKQEAEEKKKRTERERYRIYLQEVRCMKSADITDELIDRELAEKSKPVQQRVASIGRR